MVTYRASQQNIVRFQGIREVSQNNSSGYLSAKRIKNVDFYQSDVGSGTVGIRTSRGNKLFATIPDTGYNIVDMFESWQDGTLYMFYYAENDSKGRLYYSTYAVSTPTLIIDDLTLTGKCHGFTMTSSAYDVFVFTNGKELKTVCFARGVGSEVTTIQSKDYQERTYGSDQYVKGDCICNFQAHLVVATQYGIVGSHKNDITIFNDNPEDDSDSFYVDFSDKVVALKSSATGLYIFTEKNIYCLTGNPNDTSSTLQQLSQNGTLSQNAVCQYGTDVIFYDPINKNLFMIQQIDTGRIIPTASEKGKEIQSYFADVEDIKIVPAIYDNLNQLWVIINKGETILIFDANTGEWSTRKAQEIITAICTDNFFFTALNRNVFMENIGYLFNNTFYGSEYYTEFINLDSNTNLKKQKTPILLVLNSKYVNNFYVQIICNYKAKNPKHIQFINSDCGIFHITNGFVYDESRSQFGTAKWGGSINYNKKVVELSTPQTWYNIALRFYTQEQNQAFAIDSIEMKNIKIKTKTKGK